MTEELSIIDLDTLASILDEMIQIKEKEENNHLVEVQLNIVTELRDKIISISKDKKIKMLT